MRELTTKQYVMINNSLSRFIAGLADYMRKDMFPRCKDTVISTYEKAVEHIRNRKNLGGEKWSPSYPFLVVDPQMDFEPSTPEGRYHYNYPNLFGNFASTVYGPDIYDDDNVKITPGVNRYEGTIDITMWCGSIYELMDNKVRTLQIFSGLNRIVTPIAIESLVIIPEGFKDYEYNNPYTGESYFLDWSGKSNCVDVLIKNDAIEELVYPFSIVPMLQLVSISDGGEKFGGSGDIIGDHRLTFSIKWEANLITQLNILADMWPIPKIPMEMTVGLEYQFLKNPINKEKLYAPKEFDSLAYLDREGTQFEKLDLHYDKTYYYIIGDEEIESINNDEIISINIPEPVRDERFLRLYGKNGWLDRDLHWRWNTENNRLELMGFNLKRLHSSDILTIIRYKDLAEIDGV